MYLRVLGERMLLQLVPQLLDERGHTRGRGSVHRLLGVDVHAVCEVVHDSLVGLLHNSKASEQKI